MFGFRSYKWDPCLIISQIIAVQTIYYLGLCIWIFYITVVFNQTPSLDYLFSYDIYQFSNWNGRLITSAFLFNALLSGLAIVYLVGRYKQCLDFSITVHLYHFLACWIYNWQYANVFNWYMIQFLSIVIMTIFSEHLSKKFELQNIPLAPRVDL